MSYYVVHDWMVDELKLKGNELTCYAIIHSFSQDNKSFDGSLSYLANRCLSSKESIRLALNKLVAKGLIKKQETYKNGVKFCAYTSFKGGIQKSCIPSNKIGGGIQESCMGGIQKSCTNNKVLDIKEHTTLSGDLVLSPITNNSFKEKEKEKESAGVGKTNNPDVLIGNLATAFDSRKTIVNKTPINPNLKKFIATFSKDTQKRFYSWLDKSKSGKQLEPVSMLKALATIIRKPEQEIKDLYFSSINV